MRWLPALAALLLVAIAWDLLDGVGHENDRPHRSGAEREGPAVDADERRGGNDEDHGDVPGEDDDETPLWETNYGVRGRVVGSSGTPVRDAEVSLREIDPCIIRSSRVPRMTTGSDGAFAFDGLTMGNCAIAVVAPGFRKARRSGSGAGPRRPARTGASCSAASGAASTCSSRG